MKRDQIIRAWKDEDYRSGLSESERAALPENPAGIVELSRDEMKAVGGLWFGLDTIISCMTFCYVCPIPNGGPDSPPPM